MRRFPFFILITILLLAGCGQRSNSWEEIGDLANAVIPPRGSFDLTVGPDGTPYIAYVSERSGNAEIYVVRYVEDEWVTVGGGNVSNSGGTSVLPSLAISEDGIPFVAWADNSSGSPQIFVRFYDGFAWAEIGTDSATSEGISASGGDSLWPALALDSAGTPYVAWTDTGASGFSSIFIRHWDGSQWAELGAGSATGNGLSSGATEAKHPSLVIGPEGQPWLVWDDGAGLGTSVYGQRWDGSGWQEIGAGSNSGEGLSATAMSGSDNINPVLLAGPNGTVYLAWNNQGIIGTATSQSIYALQFDGNGWREVSSGSAAEYGLSGNTSDWAPAMALDNDGRLYAAWATLDDNAGYVNIQRRDGDSWSTLGETPRFGVPDKVPAIGEPSLPQLAIAGDGTVYLAWLVAGTDSIKIQRYLP